MPEQQLLRIKDWNDHYENNRTRELKRMEWIPVPNKHDGDGFSTLMDHERGLAHLGAWLLILQVASKCEIRGTLSRAGAVPHTASSIARIGHADATIIQEAIERLVGEIGWLEVVENTNKGISPQDAAGKSQDAAGDCGISAASRERQCAPAERNGMERNGTEGGAPAAAPPAAPPPLDGLDFEPMLIELIAQHPASGSIPLSRLAVREQYARYGSGDFAAFCQRLRDAHKRQRAKWSRNSKLRVREFQYWLTDGDWRVPGDELAVPAQPALPVEVCAVCCGKSMVLDEQDYGLYCPACQGGDGGKVLFEPGEAPGFAADLQRWHRVDSGQAVAG